ncbi:uncharacterized protein LOC111019909 [Momordica charantia]|uniref:Uncharacterized protein LOC111019909 n=1 Tax=Momordica charantia TaxID=3673 RepID=A0A6J1DF31_MOMCH|nr:uncharacterized protein LOC111019909 [Momordica charantia]
MGGTFDVRTRFRMEPSSSGVKDQVSRISATCLDRCLKRASKFVSDPGSVLQRTIDNAAEAFVASIHSAIMVKAELDGREALAAKERENSSAALEAATTLKGELLKAQGEVGILRAEVDAKAELLKKEGEKHKAHLRAAHAITKGLEKEKFQLLKEKDDLAQVLEGKDTSIGRLTAELKDLKERLTNGSLLEESFRQHLDFDGFAKDFSDAGFKFLMKGIAADMPHLQIDLSNLKKKYSEKWASGPNGTPGPQSLVVKYVRELDSDYSDMEEEDAPSQEPNEIGTTQEEVPSQQDGSQEVNLLGSEGELSSHLGSS